MIYWVNLFAVTPDMTGGTRHFELSGYLIRAGERVTLIASDFSSVTRSYLRRSGPTVRDPIHEVVATVPFVWLYGSPYEGNNWRRAVNMLSSAWSVFTYLLRVKVDSSSVFIGSSPHLFGALATQLAASWRRVPFIFEVRDLWPESMIDMTGRRSLTTHVLQIIANHLYRASARIIVLAEHSRDHIAKLGFDVAKIDYIPNGMDPEAFAFESDAPIPPSPITLPEGKHVFVYAGAHGPANELQVVLRAAKVLETRGVTDLHVLLVGDGVSKPMLLELHAELNLKNCTLHPPIPKGQIPALFRHVYAGILTLQDAPVFRVGVSPNKLFDYMAASLPVVTNVQGDIARIIETAQNGVVSLPSDPESLAEAMLEVSHRLESNPNFGVSGRAYVEQHHNRATLASRVINAIQVARSSKSDVRNGSLGGS
jgi:glycosyltransferase involved in cell wall biosynthesis